MTRTAGLGAVAMLALVPLVPLGYVPAQRRAASDLSAELRAADPSTRARAACALREMGDEAAPAIAELTAMLADAAPVDPEVCEQRWWKASGGDVISPGEIAASALVAIGARSFDHLMTSLKGQSWIARRNAAWALGALDDNRAVHALVEALGDTEAGVREHAAWALGAIDDRAAVQPLVGALKDANPRVRCQAAWALGALDDRRAGKALVEALRDSDERTRSQAAWALGAIDDADGVPALTRALKDPAAHVRRQAAWALGAIGDSRALSELLAALKDPEPGVRQQAAWAIGVIER